MRGGCPVAAEVSRRHALRGGVCVGGGEEVVGGGEAAEGLEVAGLHVRMAGREEEAEEEEEGKNTHKIRFELFNNRRNRRPRDNLPSGL